MRQNQLKLDMIREHCYKASFSHLGIIKEES